MPVDLGDAVRKMMEHSMAMHRERVFRGVLHQHFMWRDDHAMVVRFTRYEDAPRGGGCNCVGCLLWRDDPAEARRWTQRLLEWDAAEARYEYMQRPWSERYIDWMRDTWASANDRHDDDGY